MLDTIKHHITAVCSILSTLPQHSPLYTPTLRTVSITVSGPQLSTLATNNIIMPPVRHDSSDAVDPKFAVSSSGRSIRIKNDALRVKQEMITVWPITSQTLFSSPETESENGST